jgi:hypothetical protein
MIYVNVWVRGDKQGTQSECSFESSHMAQVFLAGLWLIKGDPFEWSVYSEAEKDFDISPKLGDLGYELEL